jgi:EmrB/QacA subfamily drug resistance transporter
MSRTHRWPTVVALLLSMFMSAMEATVVGTAMPTVIADLGGLELYGWVGAAYLLASTISVPLFGKLADLRGRKRVLLFGIALFLVGSVASGGARSLELLIAARALQGLGAGAMQPVTLTVIGDLFTLEERGRIQGLFGAVWAIAGIAGPVVGGAIVQSLSWHWVFWINVPFGLLAMGVLSRFFREARVERAPARIDAAGLTLLSVASLTALLAASRTQLALTAPCAVVALAAFAAVERRVADPVFPPSLLARRSISVATLSSGLLGATMMALLTYVPLHAQAVLGLPPTEAGASVAPMLIGWPLASAITSRLLVRTGFRSPLVLGSTLTAGALLVFVVLVREHRAALPSLQGAMFVYGLGMGLANTALLIAVQSQATWSQRGVATAATMFARSMGGALGVGALGAVLATRLGPSLSPDALRGLLEARGGAPALDPQTVQALAAGLALVFSAVAAVAVLNALAVLLYPRAVAGPARSPGS